MVGGIGAILKQLQSDGEEKPVAYFSKKLNDSQRQKKAIYIGILAVREAVKYWRYWFIGRPFTVITFHKPLEKLNFRSCPDEELGDVANYLLQYDFRIIYRPGSANSSADCLSRNPVLESSCNDNDDKDLIRTVNLLTLEEIKDAQRNLSNTPNSSYLYKDDILVRCIRNRKKIILPESFGTKLINLVHCKYGHIGASKIYLMLKYHYYFPRMYDLACKYTKSCEICMCNKTRGRNDAGLLGHFGSARRPFEIMSLDTAVGFGGRRSTKQYLHILVDHFSRFSYVLLASNQNTGVFFKIISKAQWLCCVTNAVLKRSLTRTGIDQKAELISKAVNHLQSRVRITISSVKEKG